MRPRAPGVSGLSRGAQPRVAQVHSWSCRSRSRDGTASVSAPGPTPCRPRCRAHLNGRPRRPRSRLLHPLTHARFDRRPRLLVACTCCFHSLVDAASWPPPCTHRLSPLTSLARHIAPHHAQTYAPRTGTPMHSCPSAARANVIIGPSGRRALRLNMHVTVSCPPAACQLEAEGAAHFRTMLLNP